MCQQPYNNNNYYYYIDNSSDEQWPLQPFFLLLTLLLTLGIFTPEGIFLKIIIITVSPFYCETKNIPERSASLQHPGLPRFFIGPLFTVEFFKQFLMIVEK